MFDEDEIKKADKMLNVNFINFSLDDLIYGTNFELQHGTDYELTNITNDNLILTMKIALEHLNKFPNYYNPKYGIEKFENTLIEKLNEEQYLDKNNTLDDIQENKC